MPYQEVAAPRGRIAAGVPPLVALGVYLGLCCSLLLGILFANGGHFFFALDDPYIHLALSEQIAHGTYGINAGAAASPSSSVIWPFLLVPFARFAWQPFWALGLNVAAGVLAALLLGALVARWPWREANAAAWTRRVASAVLLVFVANLPGLTFLGMEHTLQVLLAICCAWGVIACLQGRPMPWWCVLAAAVGPAVRYEMLGLTVAVAVALWGQRRQRSTLR